MRDKDRDVVLAYARKEASQFDMITVILLSLDDYWYEVLYLDFVPQADDRPNSVRYILPKGECTKLS